jgi:hypothetical protein
MNLFEQLKSEAESVSYKARISKALMETLEHFNIPESKQPTVAEALLQFRIFKDRNLDYDEQDKLLGRLLSMDKHLSRLLQESCSATEVPLAQKLTDAQLEGLSISHLFHRLWIKAVGTESYDKREWQRLERCIVP